MTALRASALGVEELNREIALALRVEKLLWFRQEDDWYIGKPIMITENDHNVKLYNGDIGLCLAKGKVLVRQSRSFDQSYSRSRACVSMMTIL